jgi:hypothetical protein
MPNKPKHGNTGKRNAAKQNPKGSQIAFRVTPEVRAKLERKAEAKGLTLSAYLCDLVEKA